MSDMLYVSVEGEKVRASIDWNNGTGVIMSLKARAAKSVIKYINDHKNNSNLDPTLQPTGWYVFGFGIPTRDLERLGRLIYGKDNGHA